MGYTVALTGGIGSGKVRSPTPSRSLGLRLSMPMLSPVRWSSPVPRRSSHCRPLWTTDDCPDGTLNRRLLREKILLTWRKSRLNALLHPLIQQETRRQMQAATSPYLLWVVPLLVENRLSGQADRVLVVDVPKETQIERTMLRDKVSREHAEHILAAQATRQQRLAVADDVIENTGTPDAVASDVARLHEKYLTLASQAASQENS